MLEHPTALGAEKRVSMRRQGDVQGLRDSLIAKVWAEAMLVSSPRAREDVRYNREIDLPSSKLQVHPCYLCVGTYPLMSPRR